MLKSKPNCYGAVAVSIHQLTAILILALLGSGFKAASLRFRIPVAIAVLLLAAFRIVWWSIRLRPGLLIATATA